jgi:hypothetical protein
VVRSRTSGRLRGQRTAAVAGIAIVAVYVLLASVSGRLSPLARRPLLDGLGQLRPYQWVNPPPDLASTNIAPGGLTLTLPLTAKGIQGGSQSSGDKQVSLIASNGIIGPHGADTSVRFDAAPVDPATLSKLGTGLAAFGNAYRIQATYLPSHTPVKALTSPLDVILIYPITVTLTTAKHEMATSPDGKRWTVRKGNDFVTSQEVETPVPLLGYVVVAGIPGTVPVIVTQVPSSSGSRAVALGLIVAAGCALLVGLGLVLRNRRA